MNEPTKQENEQSEARIKRLNQLAPLCAFDKFQVQCTPEQLQAREMYRLVLERQIKFEETYCQ